MRRYGARVALFAIAAIRPGERRDAWAAFLTLFGLIASHAMLETARDALFLAKVPARHLPWVFLSVAAISFFVVRVQSFVGNQLAPRAALAIATLGAGLVTAGFFAALDRLGPFGLYALYVWSGLLTTLILVHFWSLVGNLFSITQAKRLYGFIGAGSVLGAIAGSGAASALARTMPAQRLLVVSASGFVVTAAMPFLFREVARAEVTTGTTTTLAESLAYIRDSLYARRVVAVLFVSTICLTIADFLFKSMVARLVPAADLGAFLGTVYFTLNIVSFGCQVLLVGRLLARTSLATALAILPALVALGAVGVAVSGGLVAVIALRSADGSLRYSLHRTASELLFLPFSDEARHRVKGFMDVVGQRGGQIVASLGLLAFAAFPEASPRLLAVGLVGIAAAWVFAALALHAPYIEIFRARLQRGRLAAIEEFPELDVASLETLIATLDSNVDKEVLAALSVLEREKKVHLVPALILYHPSEEVVVRALGIFSRTRRTNVVHVLDRVLDHPSPRVRAATIAARSVLAPDAQTLLMRMSTEENAEVRATITVNLIASGDIYGTDAKERIQALLVRGTTATKVALAEAIAGRGADGFDDVLALLGDAPEPDVRRAAIQAMARIGRRSFLPLLVAGIGDEATRKTAIRALADHGDPALEALKTALADERTPAALRWRVPHAMTFLAPQPAADALLERLPNETEGSVRFQIIRALERLARRTPALVIARDILAATTQQTLDRVLHLVATRAALAREGAPKTTGSELLLVTLRDKEKNATDRLFRLLGLAHPTEDFAQIYRGLSGTRDERAASLELIDSILPEPMRTSVRAIVDDMPIRERVAHATNVRHLLALDYDATLASLQENESAAVREVATFHRAELEQESA